MCPPLQYTLYQDDVRSTHRSAAHLYLILLYLLFAVCAAADACRRQVRAVLNFHAIISF